METGSLISRTVTLRLAAAPAFVGAKRRGIWGGLWVTGLEQQEGCRGGRTRKRSRPPAQGGGRRKGKPGLEEVVSAAANEGEEPRGLCPEPRGSRLQALESLAISAQPLPSYSSWPASWAPCASLGRGRQRAHGPCGHTLPRLLRGTPQPTLGQERCRESAAPRSGGPCVPGQPALIVCTPSRPPC